MLVTDFDYDLPDDRIAQQPLTDRAGARMLVLHRADARWEDRWFRELPLFLEPGDCLVLNDSKVFPSRLFARRTGTHALAVGKRNPARQEHLTGEVQVFLLRPLDASAETWQALVRPGRKMAVGEVVRFNERWIAEVTARGERGIRTLRFAGPTGRTVWDLAAESGHIPLPPYIKRPDNPDDRDRYQTVYARSIGSVAAPTAGLHFTPDALAQCRAAGADVATVTLHVGLGTFLPLDVERLEEVRLHEETWHVSDDAADQVRRARRRVAIGTTSVRALETAARGTGEVQAGFGPTSLFISPGYQFRAADALLTNFHLPQSSLLMLVAAFAGTELTLDAYRHAVQANYRFFSYGDCMLIL